ncbi:sigma-70 family RNA polymerase sigma factor [Actinoplanes sp. CA-131856]
MAFRTADPDRPDGSPRGDVEKLRQIFEQRSGSLLRFLRRINSCRPQIVEDLLQETMLKVWRHIGEVPANEDHIQSWLFTIARNVSADEARKRGRRPQEYQGERDLQNYSAPVDPMDFVIATETMLDAFRKLSTERRRALEEIYLKSRSAGDTADLLSIPVGTAKSRAFYAMDSVRTAVFST